MAKYKFMFSNCMSQNCTCDSDDAAVLAAKESLRVMNSLNPSVRSVLVAKIVGRPRYSIVARYGL